MIITYAKRSKFTAPCKESIATQRERLETGQVITIPLGDGGYAGQTIVILQGSHDTVFETDWAGRNPTRFPARIKAAATALRDCGCMGVFAISHADGVVSMQRTARLSAI